jgi:site-specific recombinase XerD
MEVPKSWQTAREAAGMPELRLHDCRHAAASFWINSGVDLYNVGNLLGHRDYRSTTIYAHVNSSTMLAAVEAGAEKLKGSWA